MLNNTADGVENMKKNKRPILIATIISFCIIIYLLTTEHMITFLRLTNTFFMTALFFLIIGVAFWIMSSGFFDNFQRIVKETFRLKKKEEIKDFIPFSSIGFAYYHFWLEIGGILLIIAIISLLFYFFTI